ncbi:unnamed protein product [Clonostachys rosea f. rosea IK726]|uniref:Uncharacterized protein n=2 Tax=Bionectria ochroleuca TaxID=29856 RepID=A0A8H7TK58_BIOOC|nr:unnamed protein product [Clonostachys rosea f. rosea IK726]
MRFSLAVPLALAAQALAGPTFYLYAYGEGINGLEVINSGDRAYLGNTKDAPDQGAMQLDWYEWGDKHGIWYATRRDGGDFSDWAYYLPGAGSSSTQTRFTSYSQMPKDVRATGFVLDGDRAFYEEGGKRLSNWFALPVEGKKGLYTVEWGTGSVKGKIDITLSKKAP